MTPAESRSEKLPAELVARWRRTAPLVTLSGAAGLGVAVLILLLGLRLVILLWNLPVTLAISGAFLFAAALVLTPSIHLLQQGQAIRQAFVRRDLDSLADVFALQHRYWRYLGIILILVFLAILAVMLIAVFHMPAP